MTEPLNNFPTEVIYFIARSLGMDIIESGCIIQYRSKCFSQKCLVFLCVCALSSHIPFPTKSLT